MQNALRIEWGLSSPQSEYFRTNEQEIQSLSATVDWLQEQFRDWARQRYGSERIQMIDRIEQLRRDSSLKIGRAIGDFEGSIFEVEDLSDMTIVAMAIADDDKEFQVNRAELQESKVPGVTDLVWKEQTIAGTRAWVARFTR